MSGSRLFYILCLLCGILALSNCDQVKYPYGERIYLRQCADCHMDNAEGLSSLYPSLKTESIESLISEMPCIIRYGTQDSTELIKMLPMPKMSEVEIANVMNYIVQDLNGFNQEIKLTQVKEMIQNCTNKK